MSIFLPFLPFFWPANSLNEYFSAILANFFCLGKLTQWVGRSAKCNLYFFGTLEKNPEQLNHFSRPSFRMKKWRIAITWTFAFCENFPDSASCKGNQFILGRILAQKPPYLAQNQPNWIFYVLASVNKSRLYSAQQMHSFIPKLSKIETFDICSKVLMDVYLSNCS